MTLKTDYKDYQFQEGETLRKYQEISNNDGTISLRDVTSYQQEGDRFSASDINSTNAKVNELDQDVSGLQTDTSTLQSDISNIQDKLASTEIVANTDLNTIINVGDYHCPSNANATTLTNCPIKKAFTMNVKWGTGTDSGTTKYITQTIEPYKQNIILKRHGEKSGTNDWTWDSWVKFCAMSYDSSTNTLNIIM